jgi:hypothetical protein
MAITQAQLKLAYLSISTPASALNKTDGAVSKTKVQPMLSKTDMPGYVDITPVFVGIAG